MTTGAAPTTIVSPSAGASRAEARIATLDLLAVAFLAVLIRLPSLSISVVANWDESAFILMARELVAGHLPYLSFWDMKPIGAATLLALPMLVFGPSLEVGRAVGAGAVSLTACVLYLVVRRFGLGRVPALSAGLFYAAFSTRLLGLATNSEILLAPFSAAGVLVMLSALRCRTARQRGLAVAGAGVLFGLAVWIKYVPAVPATLVGACVLTILLVRSGWRFGPVLAQGAAFGVGLALPTLISVLVYWQAGDLDAFLYANFGFTGSYVAAASAGRVIRGLGQIATEFWPLLLLAGAVLLPVARATLIRAGRGAETLVVGLWLVGEFAAASLPLHFWPHYFLMVLPPLSVLAAVAVAVYAPRFVVPRQTVRAMAMAAAFVALVPTMRHSFETARALARPDVQRRVAEIGRSDLQPGDQMWVINYDPVIYLIADAPLPTRFAFPAHLIGPYSVVTPTDPHAEVARILDSRPLLLVLYDQQSETFSTESDPRIEPLIEGAIAERYTPRAAFPVLGGTVRVFILRQRPVASAAARTR